MPRFTLRRKIYYRVNSEPGHASRPTTARNFEGFNCNKSRIGDSPTACGIVQTHAFPPLGGQLRSDRFSRSVGCRGIPGSRSRDSSGNFRQEKTTESKPARKAARVSGSAAPEGKAATPCPRIVMRGIAAVVCGAPVSPLPAANLNALTSPSLLRPPVPSPFGRSPPTALYQQDASRVQRGASWRGRRGRKTRRAAINWIPDWQFPVCRTPPRFPQQPPFPFSGRTRAPGRPTGHSIKPARGDPVAIQTQHLIQITENCTGK